MKDFTEKELIGQFLLAEFNPGDILSARHVEVINAAKERIHRQLKAAQAAGSARSERKVTASRANGKRGGRPK